jgi:hypothetical protein
MPDHSGVALDALPGAPVDAAGPHAIPAPDDLMSARSSAAMEGNGSRLSNHLTLVLGAASIAIIAFRILVLAAFQPEVALQIVATADPGRVILASTIVLIPLLAAAAQLIGIIASFGGRSRFTRATGRVVTVLALVAVIGTGSLLTLISVIGLAPLYLILIDAYAPKSAGDREYDPPSGSQRVRAWLVGWPGSFLSALMLLIWLVALPPFLPTEDVKLRDGGDVVGTVIEETDARLLIVAGHPLRVQRIRIDVVAARSLCDAGLVPGWLTSAVVSLSGNKLDRCPNGVDLPPPYYQPVP